MNFDISLLRNPLQDLHFLSPYLEAHHCFPILNIIILTLPLYLMTQFCNISDFISDLEC